MFGGRFEVSRTGLEDGLRASAEFSSYLSGPFQNVKNLFSTVKEKC
jgi:hypothetical protein